MLTRQSIQVWWLLEEHQPSPFNRSIIGSTHLITESYLSSFYQSREHSTEMSLSAVCWDENMADSLTFESSPFVCTTPLSNSSSSVNQHQRIPIADITGKHIYYYIRLTILLLVFTFRLPEGVPRAVSKLRRCSRTDFSVWNFSTEHPEIHHLYIPHCVATIEIHFKGLSQSLPPVSFSHLHSAPLFDSGMATNHQLIMP